MKKYTPYTLSEETVEKLKNRLLSENRLVIAIYLILSYDSGARKREVLQVKRTDRFISKVIGKLGLEIEIRWSEVTQELIDLYLSQRIDNFEELFAYNRQFTIMETLSWCDYIGKLISEIENKKIDFNHHMIRQSRFHNLLKDKTEEEIQQIQKYGINYGGFWQ